MQTAHASTQLPKKKCKQPFRPRKLSGETPLGRILVLMEIPECSCEKFFKPYRPGELGELDPGTPIYWLRLAVAGIDEDYGRKYGVIADRPCEHILTAAHEVDYDLWGEMLVAYDPDGYLDPPAAKEPTRTISKPALVQIYRERADLRVALHHPEDFIQIDHGQAVEDVGLAVQAAAGKKHGEALLENTRDDLEEESLKDEVLADRFASWELRQESRRRQMPGQHRTRRASLRQKG